MYSERVLLKMAILYPAKEECWISITEWQDSFSVAGFCPLVMPLWQVYKKSYPPARSCAYSQWYFSASLAKDYSASKKKHFEGIRPYQQLSLQLRVKIVQLFRNLTVYREKKWKSIKFRKSSAPILPYLFSNSHFNYPLLSSTAKLTASWQHCISSTSMHCCAATGVREGATKLS